MAAVLLAWVSRDDQAHHSVGDVPPPLYPLREDAGGLVLMKPTYTHNHRGGIRTDGSCPRCNSYAETLAEDEYPDQEILFHVNTQPTMLIMHEGEIEP